MAHANNTSSLFKREGKLHVGMLLATMPKTGVVEYDDLLKRHETSGWVWKGGKRVPKEG